MFVKYFFNIRKSWYTHEWEQTVEVLDPAALKAQTGDTDIEDAGDMAEDTEMMPWSEPVEVQGIDCIAACRDQSSGIVTEGAADPEQNGSH